MRIRTIKPEFFTHEEIYSAEKACKLPLRVAFAGLWCAADREGRFKWEPRRLGVSILPYDNIEFSRVLDALTTRGFIVKYTSQGREFGWIPSFTKHQIINNREKPSDLPEPSIDEAPDATPTRDPRVTHADTVEGKGREGNKEGEGKDASATRTKARGTLDEIKAFCVEIGLPEADGIATFNKWVGNGWKNGQADIKDWKATIRSWQAAGYMPSQKAYGGNGNGAAVRAARLAGQYPENISIPDMTPETP